MITPVELIPDELKVVVNNSGLEPASVHALIDEFAPLLKQASEWKDRVASIKVTDVSQVREMEMARTTRLALRDVRLQAEKVRKRLKEDSLRRGKAIDGVYNVIEFVVAPLEKTLLDQEQFAIRKEADRKAELKRVRSAQLIPLVISPDQLAGYVLEDMTEEVFSSLRSMLEKAAHERTEAAEKLQRERVEREKAEAVERERLRLENERLQREAREREAKLAEERRVEREAREKAEAEARRANAEREKIAREAQEKLDAQRRQFEADKAEADRKRREAEKAEKARQLELDKAQKEAARKAAAAPDRAKLQEFSKQLSALRSPVLANKQTETEINAALGQITTYINDIITTL